MVLWRHATLSSLMTPSQVLRLEEAGLNALPALRTVFDGAWVVRFARGGSMKRANSVT